MQASAPHSLEELQRDCPTGFSLHALPPEPQLWVDGAMKHKVLVETFRVEGADRGVVADLLRYKPESEVLPGSETRVGEDESKWQKALRWASAAASHGGAHRPPPSRHTPLAPKSQLLPTELPPAQNAHLGPSGQGPPWGVPVTRLLRCRQRSYCAQTLRAG